jgi:hypothetical protein
MSNINSISEESNLIFLQVFNIPKHLTDIEDLKTFFFDLYTDCKLKIDQIKDDKCLIEIDLIHAFDILNNYITRQFLPFEIIPFKILLSNDESMKCEYFLKIKKLKYKFFNYESNINGFELENVFTLELFNEFKSIEEQVCDNTIFLKNNIANFIPEEKYLSLVSENENFVFSIGFQKNIYYIKIWAKSNELMKYTNHVQEIMQNIICDKFHIPEILLPKKETILHSIENECKKPFILYETPNYGFQGSFKVIGTKGIVEKVIEIARKIILNFI